MAKKILPIVELKLESIAGGGRAVGTLESGQKAFIWGGLPDEKVKAQLTKVKSKLVEGFVVEVIKPSSLRVDPTDSDSYLSTSPWQIMTFEAEQHFKSALIEEAFEMHNIVLPNSIEVFSDNKIYEYRNKIEYSWWWSKDTNQIDLAFFKRESHSKNPVEPTSLAMPAINKVAVNIRNLLRLKEQAKAYDLKTLLIRTNQKNEVVAQLYVTNPEFLLFDDNELKNLGAKSFELIFSNPKSPASVITKKLQSYGVNNLDDNILGINYTYAIDGFFQINIPVYEQALMDMKKWINSNKETVDLYSGVGTIGLTIGSKNTTLVEINEHAVNEMKQNIIKLGKENDAKAILAPSEKALEYIKKDATIIVDPPRAGLHDDVINKLLKVTPNRIIYLSCNPVTQARDVAKLAEKYGIKYHKGYNFFPRTPHIENLVVLDLK